MALLGPNASLDRYRAYLRTMAAAHAALEPVVLNDPALEALLPDLALRTRLEAARADLQALGDSGGLPTPDRLPPMETPAQRLGVLYVLEGSTLGGQFLRRELAQRLGVPDGALRYVGGYGAETGARWKRFLEALEQGAKTPEARLEATFSAQATFAGLQRWFEEAMAASGSGG